ncbi:tRNA glutamyl-Q(34) synthetase GluQRS [Falsigemmobacter intermedius]|uniref:tRNA glutamyl-Q(34) synthetase GluQRS n=1 Tax=Falsigemmobacter intermedius TaxID=1553448 RepID=A0A3S3YBH4_9RHOB|nr:tRNA glutamyl-Q(34) synthetase GluQRS [Falsigemmobacter intermedius]RWY40638.1 tRNA glutamyl-Q(34) synthetase GluQRS [Falsigemmobacter intermedius]
MAVVTRFAPSPTGPLHLGHAFAAITAHDMARAAGGRFLLRIEDIDPQRSKPLWRAQLIEDLTWLGLTWDEAPLCQSDRRALYVAALDDLWSRGLLYPCRCSRRDIEQALGAPQEGVSLAEGPDGPVYPGRCRCRPEGPRPQDQHLRLNIAAAARETRFTETAPGLAGEIRTEAEDYPQSIGDIVLARKDFGTSYHLSVVLDDAAQGITHVTRGADLFEATRIHVLLQDLLDLPRPVYHHHALIRDAAGRRLAKRDDARALSKYRAEGAGPQDIRRMLGL